MKGDYPAFDPPAASNGSNIDVLFAPINGVDYNTAGATDVQDVLSVVTAVEIHTVPDKSQAFSVTRAFRGGELRTERYYDEKGMAYLDIDYTAHGNTSQHVVVPHKHSITWENGKLKRGKGVAIK